MGRDLRQQGFSFMGSVFGFLFNLKNFCKVIYYVHMYVFMCLYVVVCVFMAYV